MNEKLYVDILKINLVSLNEEKIRENAAKRMQLCHISVQSAIPQNLLLLLFFVVSDTKTIYFVLFTKLSYFAKENILILLKYS